MINLQSSGCYSLQHIVVGAVEVSTYSECRSLILVTRRCFCTEFSVGTWGSSQITRYCVGYWNTVVRVKCTLLQYGYQV